MDRTNVFEDIEYRKFSYSEYRKGEQEIIQPQLEELGYYDIRFYNLEADSFGPLIRGIEAVRMEQGNLVRKAWYYG